MKYLKTYALFESLFSESEAKIRDILCDLTDNGFEVELTELPLKKMGAERGPEGISIDISKGYSADKAAQEKNKFTWIDIKDVINNLISHISDRYELTGMYGEYIRYDDTKKAEAEDFEEVTEYMTKWTGFKGEDTGLDFLVFRVQFRKIKKSKDNNPI